MTKEEFTQKLGSIGDGSGVYIIVPCINNAEKEA